MRCRRCGFENPHGMRFCGGCGAPLREGITATWGEGDEHAAQRRHMTALFCDLVGSTPLAERLDPEDFREVLAAYQRACTRAIERLDGYPARYIGDAVVAYFGYPRAHEDDAQRAVHAALGILDELAELNASLKEPRIPLQVRIGLHTGVVVAGQMGTGDMPPQHEIVGEMPHIAARIESIAPPGSVVISGQTLDFVEGYFETEPLGEKSLKGVSRPIAVHRVLRPTGAVGRLEVATGRPLTPVIGRDAELLALARAWDQARQGQGSVVHITGEAGIGKSRLVHALRNRLGDQPRAVRTWQCSAHHTGTSLYPVIRGLERLLGLERLRTGEVRLNGFEEAARDAGLAPGEALPLLADLLSIEGQGYGANRPRSPRDARTATLRMLESLLVTSPAHLPLLLIVEDLQWADPTTIELLDRITANISEVAVMCLLTFRKEAEPPWTRDRPVLEIDLGPLGAREVQTMVAAASDAVPDQTVVAWINSASDGVPLFIEEMLKMLKVGARPDRSQTRGIEPSVPPTLEGLLTERLDRLPDLGDVIDVASVVGREFERELLEALDPLRGAELEPAIALLEHQGIVRPVAGARSRFEFTHALLQEAAYERLLRRRRRALHGRVAEILTERFPAVAEREPEIVAHHWTCAEEPAKAIAYWRAAGTRALERAAFREAAEHFRRGLQALEDSPPGGDEARERADLLTYRAAALQAAYGYACAGVDEAYAAARSTYERAGNDDRLVVVIRGQWMFHLLRGHYGNALELADEMLALGERGEHPFALAEGHLYRGLVHMYLGQFTLARQHLEKAFDNYRRPELPDQIYDAQGDTGVGALAYNAIVLWNLGYPQESLGRSDLSLELAEQVGGQVTRAQAWGMRTMLHLNRGEPTEFGRWVQMASAHSVEHNIGYWRIVSALFSGWSKGRAGEPRIGAKEIEDSLDEYIASGCKLALTNFYVLLADLRLAAGDQGAALEALRAGEQHLETTGERFFQSELSRFMGRTLMEGPAPDPDAATAAYEQAVAAARAQEAKLPWLRAATHLAMHRRNLGAASAELDELSSLCEWFGECELPDVTRARALLAAQEAV
jgi:class 3 adenylate cyclase/tetratricopeptide (TPR) repeat protein